MSRTSILITPCGGIGTTLTFLRPNAKAIVMNYWLPQANTSVQMESMCALCRKRRQLTSPLTLRCCSYYHNLEYIDIEYFAVLPEDYETTMDRPGCEKTVDDPYYHTQAGIPH